MNIVISVISVSAWGVIGVSMGTLVAMAYQTVWMAWYNSKNLLHWPFRNFLKQLLVDMSTVVLCVISTRWIHMNTVSYFGWVLMAIKTVCIVFAIVFIINAIFYRNRVLSFGKKQK